MDDENSVRTLIAGIRKGDPQSAVELVQRYEHHVRRVVRMRLTDARLRRQIDSMDVVQSVLGNFFVRLAHGQFDIETPDQLMGLLATLARHRLQKHVETARAAKRDVRRSVSEPVEELEVVGSEPTPSIIVANRELLAAARARLSSDELRLAESRAAGRTWDELAQEENATPDALRKKLARALDRVASEMGLQ